MQKLRNIKISEGVNIDLLIEKQKEETLFLIRFILRSRENASSICLKTEFCRFSAEFYKAVLLKDLHPGQKYFLLLLIGHL